jgi:GNAT superfamily N-acetyltransferase
VRIRDARSEDAEGLAALLAELGYPDSADRVESRLNGLAATAGSFVVVAEEADSLVGAASASVIPLLHEDGRWCRLSALVVAGESRRAGIGRALVGEVEERARAADCRYLEVTSGERAGREAAHAFYESLGLGQVSRRYLRRL